MNNNTQSWRQREVEKARLRKEQQRLAEEEIQRKKVEKTENNFPALVRMETVPPVSPKDQSFAELAAQWEVSERIERAIAAHTARKEEERKSECRGVVLQTFNRSIRRYDEEEEEMEEEPQQKSSKTDYEGWTEVRRKAIKKPRELTEQELMRKYIAAGQGADDDDNEMNTELFKHE